MNIYVFTAAFMPTDQSTLVAIQRVTPNNNYCGGQEYMDIYVQSFVFDSSGTGYDSVVTSCGNGNAVLRSTRGKGTS
jgi:hypothetical protein